MAFQIKNFVSITASIINHIRGTTKKITDFQPGSVARTLSEASAVEIEEFYLQMFDGLRDAIPVATFKSFGFDKLPKKYAQGFVSVSKETPPAQEFTVATGTEFNTSDGRSYYSTADVIWRAGAQSVRIPIAATEAGVAYNVAAGAINSSPAFDSSYTISNSTIDTGRDEETDSEREARFADFIGSLSRGTIEACTYASKTAQILDENGNIYEYVTRSGLYEIPGYVRIYLYSSRGLPSAGLIARAQQIIDGWKDETTGVITPGYRAGGVRCDVLTMTERAVPFSGSVEMLPGYAFSEAVRQRMADVYASLLIAAQPGSVIKIGEVTEALLGVVGIKSVVPSVNENIVCGVFEALIPGAFTIKPL